MALCFEDNVVRIKPAGYPLHAECSVIDEDRFMEKTVRSNKGIQKHIKANKSKKIKMGYALIIFFAKL